MGKNDRKRAKKLSPPLVPLRYGEIYCELCDETIRAGEQVGWWPLARWGGRSRVERPTAYCQTCHTSCVRAQRALEGTGRRSV